MIDTSRSISSKRQHLGALEPGQALRGHAVLAAEVAAVGDRDPQVRDAPAMAVEERVACSSDVGYPRGDSRTRDPRAHARQPAAGGAAASGANGDRRLHAWWYMQQVNADRRDMSDHSWVHIQIVANIALRLFRLLNRRGRGAGDGARPRHEAARRRGRDRRRLPVPRHRHVDPPHRPRAVLAVPRRRPAAAAARGHLRRAGADRGHLGGAARGDRPPPPRRSDHDRGRHRPRGGRARHGERAARASRSRRAGPTSTRSRPPRSTRSRSSPARSAPCGSRSR